MGANFRSYKSGIRSATKINLHKTQKLFEADKRKISAHQIINKDEFY